MAFSINAPGIGQGLAGDIAADSGLFVPDFLDQDLDPLKGQTYSARAGSYIRVDDTVFVSINILLSSKGTLTPSDQINIGNLPFTVNAGITSQAYSGFGENLTGFSNQSIAGRFLSGTNRMELTRWSSSLGTESLNVNFLSNTGHLQFSGAYFI